jgi:phosphoenolpyruvate carboxykinase (ATP)
MTDGRVNPDQTLEKLGVSGLGTVHYNLMEPALIEAALRRGEGRWARAARSWCRPASSPAGRRRTSSSSAPPVEDKIWWDNNAPMAPDAFDRLMPTCWST